jgi:hypothetical protein
MAQENIQEQILHECTCQADRGHAPLPQEGQQVRVELLKDMQSWEGNKRVTIPAGTTYEGKTTAADPEGFFDITDQAGQSRKFYVHDSSITVQIVTEAAPA